MKNVLEKLVMNSQKAIDDGIYDITETLPKSKIDLEESIRNNVHASLITEIGSPEYFIKIRKNVEIPLLMKDITINKMQIDAAKKMGADYFLLIQALFDNGFVNEIDEFIDYGHKNGLKILLESHTKTEFDNAMKTNADIIGINNRNLDTLEINLETTKQILENSQKSKIILSESGINSSDDVKFLRDCGADAFLIGTSIMKSPDIENKVSNLVNAI